MKHLEEVGMGYFRHLFFAWHLAAVLIVHGLLPNVLTTYVSDKLRDRHK